MKKRFFCATIVVALTTLVLATVTAQGLESELDGEERKEKESVFTSLLNTLSSSNESPLCPGRCFNALAALACRDVVDKPGVCLERGYRCCRNLNNEDEEPNEIIDEKEKPKTEAQMKPESDSEVDVVSKDEKEVNNEENKEEPKKGNDDKELDTATEKKTGSKSDLLQYSPPLSVKVCPGVCVAERISNFCEAAIDAAGLCKPELRCCVPKGLFDGVNNVPDEFVVLNQVASNKTEEESRSEATIPPKPSTTSPTTIATTSRTTTTPTTTTTTTEPTTSYSRERVTNDPDVERKPPADEDFEGIPPERRCKGTCVAGFFAFLCDAIDRTGECPRGGRCCVTQSSPRPRPDNPNRPNRPNRPNKEKQGSNDVNTSSKPPRRTTPKPRRTRPTTTTTLEPPTTASTDPPPPPCEGTCLPVSVASRCQSPSRLVVSTGCRDDEICCDDFGRRPAGNRPQSSPSKPVAPSLGSLLSLFGAGPAKDKRPKPPQKRPRPPRPRTTTTTTTTTATTLPPTTEIPLPDCPGTCISIILSFTCFGNAEISDLFKCEKEKQSCCSPKSAIRDLNIRNEINNIAKRNDTVFDQHYNHYGHPPFEHPSFVQNPYEQPSYDSQPYPQQEGASYHQPTIYDRPPPPPHLQIPQQHQQGTFDRLPLPPYSPTDKQQFPAYHQPAPNLPGGAQPTPQQPYYQPGAGPIYQQNQSAGFPYPGDVTTLLPSVLTTPSPDGSVQQVANKYVCGVKGTNRGARVVGGEDSVPGEWCWQVALINSLNQYLCGGALIGTQWVLTAAHCVTNIVRSGDAIYVRVGDHDLTTRFGSPGAQTIPVATTYIHHNHNSQTLDNDIALLKLSDHAELGNGVCLVCLPARGVSQVAGKRCIVTGYGYMGETGPIPLRVREAEIPVVSDNECVRKINAVTEKIFILPASSFCAGGESGHDACQGDGGGPLVCNVDNYFELSGLVSWGFGCGRQDVPGVYVKVSSFIGWVNQIISVNNL